MQVADDLQLTTAGPPQVTGAQAQRVGTAGLTRCWYWIVTHYPIGTSITGPLFVSDRPDTLSPTSYVTIVWNPAIGATAYDVLRTSTPVFPSTAGNYALATGTTQTNYLDQGSAPSSYNPAGLTYGAPATRTITLNNRDFSQPMIVLDAIRVSSITFPDGTSQSSAAAGLTAPGPGTVMQGGGGRVGADGTIFSLEPAWSCTHGSTGSYTINHDLHRDPRTYVVVVTPSIDPVSGGNPPEEVYFYVSAQTMDSFTITALTGPPGPSGNPVDCAFNFICCSTA